MIKKITNSFLLAFQNIYSHFFHTILSLLGIVIGVASLVSILSLIDGMEEYAQEQITNTTSLKAIVVQSETNNTINGVSVRKDSVKYLTYPDFKRLLSSLSHPAKGYLFQRKAKEVTYYTLKTAAYNTGTNYIDSSAVVLHGRKLTSADLENGKEIGVITEALANSLAKQRPIEHLIGKKIEAGEQSLEIVGIIQSKRVPGPEVFYPITLINAKELNTTPPYAFIEADHVIHVNALRDEIDAWLKKRFADEHAFSVKSNEIRAKQAAQGFFLFRLVMGLIVGISVIVGGIGVMNVLLISVTERTSEIGVRKAVGASKGDIILQFLSESITISLLGSFVGLVIGILATLAIIPIIRSLTQAPFQAAFTLNTLVIISTIAVVVGIVFGTYPALRASKLDPVEAIRRE
ncbi:ABC transporter permease [Chryseosolibacter indicus]|uniref:ABC transporter permease n=1 Tax=Chryseosolibacter indicus TaxID=2782351 RepID=A0ABS5VSC7_9BACT|nr:ABC transporter permease [Chryseosolibacter indicus]MBT1703745.1 ABC transporter permease [Chryseosolibacter indicus]